MFPVEFQKAIDKILSEPISESDKEDIEKRLISLGILDTDKMVSERFCEIIYPKHKMCYGEQCDKCYWKYHKGCNEW